MTAHEQIDKTLAILKKKQQITTMLDRLSERYGPYQVLISTILSARAKDETTEKIAEELFKKYPDAKKLARAKKEEVIKIIRKIGFYNAKSKNIIGTAQKLLNDYNGEVPDKLEELVKLPGVGRKVANCVLVYSFGKDAIPVDIHVHRISNRLGWVKTKTPEETEKKLEKLVPREHWQILNDTFVSHGKTICTPIGPKCSQCPIYKYCKRVGVKKSR